MKRSFPLRFLPIIGALAFFFMASIIAAQSNGASLLQPNDGAKESRKVKIRLVHDNGKTVTMTQFVGKMMTVTFNSQSFGFVPKIDDQTGAVSLVLHRIEDNDGQRFRLAKELETIPVNRTFPSRSSSVDLPFSVLMDEKSETPGETVRATPTSASFRSPIPGGQGSQYLLRTSSASFFQDSGNCCVTCNGERNCACAVEADCGSCCAPRCCGFL